MNVTLGDLKKAIQDKLTEPVKQDTLILDAINDSITDVWEALLLSNLSSFLGGKATVSFAPGSDVAQLVSIVDPVAPPVVALVIAGALTQHNLAVTYTLVTDSGTETLPSPITNVVVLVNRVAQVSPPARVAATIGWNCYFNGIRQNSDPLSWVENFNEDAANGPIVDGPDAPQFNSTADDIWYLKTLWADTPNGELSWDQTEIGSQLWHYMANQIATQSPYQGYVYDLTSGINGNQLRVRPLPQTGTTANYFWISRPRKLKYDASYLPFQHPSAEPYVKYNSMSLISLSQHEYEASKEWKALADRKLLTMTLTNAAKRSNSNNRIVPFIKS